MSSVLNERLILNERYQILRSLGQGSSAITYSATDLQTEQVVAIKVFSLNGLKDWKQLELFEREAQVLQHLDHPNIPHYLNFFKTDVDGNQCFCLVQELAQGQSLAAKFEAGWQASEADAKRIAKEILQVLIYLHGLNPPLIHRDLKPQNIILGDDGQISIVDFGAVQSVYQDTMLVGSTIVGTYGYTAPEQFRGAARPASDLYALGGTLIFLLSGCCPADLPQNRMKIDFRRVVQVSEGFAHWLDRLLEPLIEDRLASSMDALATLDQPELLFDLFKTDRAEATHFGLRFAPNSKRLRLQTSKRRLHLTIVPGRLSKSNTRLVAVTAFFYLLLGSLTLSVFVSGAILSWAGIFLIFAPFCAVSYYVWDNLLQGLLGQVELRIDDESYCLEKKLLGWCRTYSGPRSNLYGVNFWRSQQDDSPYCSDVALKIGIKEIKLGTWLSQSENRWLAQELSTFLQ